MVSTPETHPSCETSVDEPDDQLVVTQSQRWRSYRWGVLPLAIALTLGSVYWLRTTAQSESATALSEALPVDVLTVETVSQYATERQYTGELVAGRSSTLGFERSGTVVSLWVEEGDRVGAGQPLARLDTRTLETQRQQLVAQRQAALAQLRELQAGSRSETIAAAEATVAEIQQQLALAQLQRDRREALYTEGAISREAFDQEQYNTSALQQRLAQAQSQLTELQAGARIEQLDAQAARVSQIDASLRQIDVDLDKSVLLSPFAGTISTRAVDEGVVVSGGQPVVSLIELAPLKAKVGVPPAVADRLPVGSQQNLRVGDRPVTATLTALLPELDTASRTVTVVLEISATDLTVGQTVRLLLQENQATEGIWLPTTALVPGERGLWSVYVLTDPETPHSESTNLYTVSRRDVEVVHTEGDRALVRGTLQGGEKAIATGTHRIVPGKRVRVD